MDIQQILVPVLATAAVGGVLFALVGGDTQADKRKAALQTRRPSQVAAVKASDATKRKKQVAESLKEIDARASKKISFETRMAQAGVDWTKKGFYGVSAAIGISVAMAVFLISTSLVLAVGTAVIFGLGVPRWVLGHLKKRRIKKFLNELPGAVDIIVRGIKAGIPLGDCLRNIAAEANEPVKTEFRHIVEAQTMGLTIAEAVERLVESVPTSEANFFAIVINIQSKAGGNLAEALSNLSAVLRDRKKMKAKVKAVSSEAKSSAAIIGALPPLVGGIVYVTSPDYMTPLFVTHAGHLVLLGCLVWMSIGIFVMKKLINFDI